MSTVTIIGKPRQIDVVETAQDVYELSIAANPILDGTEGVTIPNGPIAGRPSVPEAGMVRGLVNKALVDKVEFCDSGLNWHSLATEEFVVDAISSLSPGSVTSVGVNSTTLNVSGSPITSNGFINIDLNNVGTAGTYGWLSSITTNAFGQVSEVTSALNKDVCDFSTLGTLRLPNSSLVSTNFYLDGDIRYDLGYFNICTTAGTGATSVWNRIFDNSKIIPVVNGGTGINSFTPYGVICSGTTNTGPLISVGFGAAGSVLVSNGNVFYPSWSNSPALSGITATPSTTTPFSIIGTSLRLPSITTPISTMTYAAGDLRNNLGTIQICTTAGLGSAAVWSNLSSTGTVTSVGITGSGITVTGSPITSSGSISLGLSGVGTAGTYSWPSSITTNASGQVSAVASAVTADILSLSTLGSLRLPSTALVSTNNYSSGDLRLSSSTLSLCTTAGTGSTAVWSYIPVATGGYTCTFTTTANTALTLPTTGTLATTATTWGVAQGGTGLTTSGNLNSLVVTGNASTSAYSQIAGVSTGSVLSSNGVGLAPIWSSSPALSGIGATTSTTTPFSILGTALRLPNSTSLGTMSYGLGDIRNSAGVLQVCTTAGSGSGGIAPNAIFSNVLDTSDIISAANGGTGVNNGTNTITLGGNLITSGGATTLTVTGATNVTLPTTGTLATTAAIWDVAHGGTGLTTSANLSSLVLTGTGSTSAYQNLANGASGSVLVSGGVGVVPSWSTSLNLNGNVNIGGTLTALSTVTCTNNLAVGAATTMSGTLAVAGLVTLGNAVGSATAGGVVALTGNTARSVQIPTSTSATAPTVGEMRISNGVFQVCLVGGTWTNK